MALFTDFFPSGGENTNVVNTVLGNETTGTVASGGNAGAVGQTLNFSGLSNDNLAMGDRVQVDIGDGIEITGTVTAIDNDADTATVRLDHPDMLPAVGTTGISIMEVTTVGATSFNGELNAGGNTNLSTGSGSDATIGDSTGATGSSTTITGDQVDLGNGNTSRTDVLGADINIGDLGTNSIDLGASAITLGDNDAVRTTITSGTITLSGGDNPATVTVGSGQTSVGSDTTVQGETVSINGDTIEIGETADTATIRFGRGCETISIGQTGTTTTFTGDVVATELFAASGESVAGQVASWAESNDTNTIPASKLPNLSIAEVHVITLPDASTTNNNGIVTAADVATYLSNTAIGSPAAILHEGDTIVASGTTDGGTRGDGATVTFIYVTSGTTGKTTGTAGIVAADFHEIASSVSSVTSITGGNGIDVNSSTGSVTASIDVTDLTSGNILRFNGNSGAAQTPFSNSGILYATAANQGSRTGVEVGDIIFDEGIWVDADATFANTLEVTGTGATTLGGTLEVTGDTTLTGGLTANGAVTLGDASTDAITINGDTTHSGSLTANGNVTLGNASTDTVTINGTTEFSQPVTFPTSQSFVAGGSGATTLGATSRELRVVGTGISTATDAEPLQLVVGADGQIMTATAGGGGGSFDLLIGTTAGAQVTITNGDLIVLPPLGSGATAARNVAFPSSPVAGTSFEISNLSTTGDGSNGQIWTIGASGDVVMGETLTSAFELDDNTASFKFVYTNATYGWVIVGAN